MELNESDCNLVNDLVQNDEYLAAVKYVQQTYGVPQWTAVDMVDNAVAAWEKN